MFAHNRLNVTIIPIVTLVFAVVAATVVYQPGATRSATPIAAATPEVTESTDHALNVVLETLPEAPYIVSTALWTYQPGSTYEIAIPGWEVYSVEAGSLSLRSGAPLRVLRGDAESVGTVEEITTVNVDVTLHPGDQAIVPMDATHTIRNDGDAPLEFLNLVIFPASLAIPSWLSDAGLPRGVSARDLASDVIAEADVAPSPPVQVSVDRLTIPSNGSQPPGLTAASYLLIVVETGNLDVVVNSRTEQIGEGETIRIPFNAPRELRNSGNVPVTMLILSIDHGEGAR